MKKLMRHFFLLCLLLGACARPDYITDEEWQRLNQKPTTEEVCSTLFPATKICGEVAWSNTPTSSGMNEFILQLHGDTSQFENLTALLWMPSMGHGSAPVKIEPLGDGRYRIYNVYFIMPGDWEVRLFLKKAGQTVDQLFIPLMIP